MDVKLNKDRTGIEELRLLCPHCRSQRLKPVGDDGEN
jgi:hypothetical protein